MKRPAKNQRKHALVIGGAGGMGAWAARNWLARLPDVARVTLADVREEIPSASVAPGFEALEMPVDAVRLSYPGGKPYFDRWRPVTTAAEPPESAPNIDDLDVVLLGVPAERMSEVAAAFGPALPDGAWMFDLCSVKAPPVAEMLRHAGPDVFIAGTHPLFGAAAASVVGRPVVVTPTDKDDGSLAGWLESGLKGLGAHVIRAEPEEHDHYMLIAQTLTHFTYLTFGHALTKAMGGEFTLGGSLRFATPPYQALAGFTSRIIAQNPRLYAQIQSSARSDEARELLVESARELANRFSASSQEEIEQEIRELAEAYSGEDVARAFASSQAFFNGVSELGGTLRRRMAEGRLTVLEVGSPVRPPQRPRRHAGLVKELRYDSVVLRGDVVRADEGKTAVIHDQESAAAAMRMGLSGKPQDVEIPLYRVLRVFSDDETNEWRATELTAHERHLSVLAREDMDLELARAGLERLCSRVSGVSLEPVEDTRWLERYGMRQIRLRVRIYGDRDPALAMEELQQWVDLLGFVTPRLD